MHHGTQAAHFAGQRRRQFRAPGKQGDVFRFDLPIQRVSLGRDVADLTRQQTHS